jgi:hypothetical protein
MFYKKKLRNYAKGGDERTIESTGRAAIITLIIGVGIFLIEMIVKAIVTQDLNTISWEAALLLVMIVHLLNKIPMNK